MSLLSRLFGTSGDPRAAVRPLWHRIIEIAREEPWYADYGVADNVSGRFDAVTLVLALAMLRMERGHAGGGHKLDEEAPLVDASARLTELFVEDMDGQLRQSGVGDLVVGKRMGKLVSVLGGRIGALRAALAQAPTPEGDPLEAVLERNVTLTSQPDLAGLAAAIRALHTQFQGLTDEALLQGTISR
ncbi:hypothetical protein MTR62_14260 [Novosphingobium sp. 1949]|uniref:Ubiquinol-cytochrome c chaperone domain-containing protein n=1 Tax=Novosphingobium organovorum TaxID=2930092 RepID=A0ABT0BFT4_9SPHN|nr:ubiquinol-cytochrome C chaperone family protein [Novosphingobium organovorum]MCJ2183848.1 hypothetical protein [Novosphingobium organovorum]